MVGSLTRQLYGHGQGIRVRLSAAIDVRHISRNRLRERPLYAAVSECGVGYVSKYGLAVCQG